MNNSIEDFLSDYAYLRHQIEEMLNTPKSAPHVTSCETSPQTTTLPHCESTVHAHVIR
jgi:hypothetical protein